MKKDMYGSTGKQKSLGRKGSTKLNPTGAALVSSVSGLSSVEVGSVSGTGQKPNGEVSEGKLQAASWKLSCELDCVEQAVSRRVSALYTILSPCNPGYDGGGAGDGGDGVVGVSGSEGEAWEWWCCYLRCLPQSPEVGRRGGKARAVAKLCTEPIAKPATTV